MRNPSLNENAQYSSVPGARGKQNIDRTTRAHIEQAYGKLPMRFEANEGQTDARVKFIARGAGYSVFLTGDEAVMQLHKQELKSEGTAEQRAAETPVESVALRMKLAGSNSSSRVSGIGRLSSSSNYFIGNDPAAWRKGISNYSKVRYESVYPGIDLVWYGNQRLLEHDFLIAPGADPSRIRLSFSGMDKMSIDGEASLVLQAGDEDLRMLKPHAWQESTGGRRAISCDYSLSEKDQVEFRLGDYDTTLPLVIDPVLVYSTYIGGIGTDTGLDIAVDDAGAAYISGQTSSSDFPANQIRPTIRNLPDAYVLKINPAGDAIVFGALIGGDGGDSATTVSVDPGGNIYLAGSTSSTNFPLQNPLQTSRRGIQDAFAVKIDASGSTLLFSTYLGGEGIDSASSLAVAGDGNLYLTGSSDSGDFPLVNAFQTVKTGSGAYVSDNGGASWSEIGNGLSGGDANDLVIFPGASSTIFAGTDRGVFKSVDGGSSWTLLGGPQFIRNINQIIVDPTSQDILYAVTANQLFKSVNGGATWVLKPLSGVRTIAIDPVTPSKLYAGTIVGLSISSNGGDSWTSVTIPPVSGGIIGTIEAVTVDPVTPTTVYVGPLSGIYKSVNGGATWTFAGAGIPIPGITRITRIAISPSNPGTLYAMSNNTSIYKTIDAGGNWVKLNTPAIGTPAISALPLPLAVSPDNPEVVSTGSRGLGILRSNDGGATWNSVNNGLGARDIRGLVIDSNAPGKVYAGADSGTDAFIAKLDTTTSSLVYSSYLGGGAADSGLGIAVDSSGAAYITGSTTSINFPVANAFQPSIAGLGDAYVAKINETGSSISWATYLGGSGSDTGQGIALGATGEIFITGGTTSNDFPVNNPVQPSLNGTQDAYIVRMKNDGSGLDFSTYLGGSGAEVGVAIAVDAAGAAYVTGLTTSVDFPTISAAQSSIGGSPSTISVDAFVTKLNTSGTAIIYSTYLGGGGTDQGLSIAVDTAANAYVTGVTLSSDFPTTPFPIRATGVNDAFVTKLGASADLAITLSGAPNPVMVKKELTYSLIAANNGPDPAAGARVTVTLPQGAPLVSAASSIGSCSGESVIHCELGDLAPGSAAEITIIVSPSSVGTIIAGANVMSGTLDINPANNTATLETSVSLSPSIYGRVTIEGGAGVSGVTVAVDGSGRPPVVTAGDGYYQVSELTKGASYTVTPSRQGYVFHPPSREINKLQSDRRADFGAVACAFSLSTTSLSFPATGGIGDVTLSSADHLCAWTATSNAPWIKLISAPAGNGSGSVKFEVEPTVGSRNGTITIAGLRLKVFQEFNACESASFNATPRIDLPLDDYGHLMLVNDFNQDSRLDMVILKTTIGSKGFLFFPGASDGAFGSPVTVLSLPEGQGVFSDLAAGDFNSDGALDIVTVSNDGPSARRVWVILNNGAGGFAPPLTFNIREFPTSITTGDFNSDGKTDLVIAVANLNNDRTTDALLFLNDGNGGFGQPQEIRPNIGFFLWIPQKVKAVDLDNDGKLDLVFFNSGLSVVTTYKGDGAGGFTFQPVSDTDLGFSPAGAIGDFNGDSHPDILAVASSGSVEDLVVYLNDGTGSFGAPVRTPTRQGVFSTQGAIAEDFDGDGKTDVVLRTFNLSSQRTTGIRSFTATTGGRFSGPIIFQPSVVSQATAAADFNRDGAPDIISVNLNGSFTIVSAQGGGFNAPRGFDFSPPGVVSPQFSATDLKSGDLNGDGAMDLVIAASGLSDAVMMFGDGRGALSDSVLINSGVTDGFPVAIELRDFNNDGKPDLALLNSNTRNVVVLLGDGQGGFTQCATFGAGAIARGLVSADFNNDGNIDLVVRGQSSGLDLYLGNGQGGFTQSATGIGGNVVNVLFTNGDFNGDGIADLALFDDLQSPTGNGVNIVILIGDGRGGFGEPSNVMVQERLILLRAADLNLDGRDDLIYTQGFVGDALFVILSNPEGGFGAPVRYQVGGGTKSVVSTDINGDAKPDLISASFSTGTIGILLGKGDGGFNQPVNLPVISATSVIGVSDFDVIAPGDFDGDGAIDLAISQGGSSLITALKNRSICAPTGGVVPASPTSKFRYRVARNSIVTLHGENLSPDERAAIPPFLPTSLADARVKIKDSAGAEGISPGADQVKLRLQPSLRGSGEVSVELSVDGRAANTVRIKIK